MQKGTIPKLLSYYLDNEKFSEEASRAADEFFEGKKEEDSRIIDVAEPYFNEWFVFDFKLKNGKTPLEDFYYRNPYNKPLYEMQIYKDLQENIYGLLEVLKVEKEQGLDVLVLHTRQKFFVREYSLTLQAKRGDIFFGRVAKAGDHYELAGADTFFWGMTFDKNIKKAFYESEKKHTPKDAFDLAKSYYDKDDEEKDLFSDSQKDPEILMQELDQYFEKSGLGKIINAKLVKGWISDIDFGKTHPSNAIISIIFGLIAPDKRIEDFDKLVKLLTDFLNNTPHCALNGKSPSQMQAENPDILPQIHSSVNKVGDFKSWKHFDKAASFMHGGQMNKALLEFEAGFKKAKKEYMVFPEIYRIYANLANCYFFFGETHQARKCLRIALDLNSNYDFAIKIKDRYESGKLDEKIADNIRMILSKIKKRKGVIADLKRKINKLKNKELIKEYADIKKEEFEHYIKADSEKYYEWLSQFKINFKTDQVTVSSIVRQPKK